MRNYTYPTPLPCQTDWASRPLTELVTHLSRTYRRATRHRTHAITVRLRQMRPFEHDVRHAELARLAYTFGLLDDGIEEHLWLEDDVLCPAIVKLERPGSFLDSGACEALCQMVIKVADEHRRIRTMVDQLVRAVDAMPGPPSPCEQALLVNDLEMLGLILNEQMDFEDGSLWPRALDLYQQRS